jgi:hypothetical protein
VYNLSKTTWALVVKFLLTLASAFIAFQMFDNNSFGWILGVSLIGTILNYLIGDLYILDNFGNLAASIADGGLAAMTAYLMSVMSEGNNIGISSLLVFGLLVAVAEYFFHRYLLSTKKVEPNA